MKQVFSKSIVVVLLLGLVAFWGYHSWINRFGHFEYVGEMVYPRAGHNAVLLHDGRVLIVNGCSGCKDIRVAEIYNPSLKKSIPIGHMQAPHNGGTVTVLKNGKVLIAGGGGDNKVTNLAEIYDPDLNKFTLVTPMKEARNGHTATLLKDGRVLIAGGDSIFGTALKAKHTTEIFDSNTNQFSYAAQMYFPRKCHTATLLSNDNILMIGGADVLNEARDSELYNIKTGKFELAPKTITYRYNHEAATTSEGNILICCGQNPNTFMKNSGLEIYSLRSNTFEEMNYTIERRGSQITLLNNALILITGGSDRIPFSSSSHSQNSTVIINTKSKKVFSGPPMKVARTGHQATLLSSGEILLTGGQKKYRAFSSIEILKLK